MLIYKKTKVQFSVLLRKHHDIKLAETDGAAYTPYLGPHRKLILTVILLKFSQINLKLVCIQTIEK